MIDQNHTLTLDRKARKHQYIQQIIHQNIIMIAQEPQILQQVIHSILPRTIPTNDPELQLLLHLNIIHKIILTITIDLNLAQLQVINHHYVRYTNSREIRDRIWYQINYMGKSRTPSPTSLKEVKDATIETVRVEGTTIMHTFVIPYGNPNIKIPFRH